MAFTEEPRWKIKCYSCEGSGCLYLAPDEGFDDCEVCKGRGWLVKKPKRQRRESSQELSISTPALIEIEKSTLGQINSDRQRD